MAIRDGQHRHGSLVKKEIFNCFFCMKDKQDCVGWVLKPHIKHAERLKILYNQAFALCPECRAKGLDFIMNHLLHWVNTQELLQDKKLRIKNDV